MGCSKPKTPETERSLCAGPTVVASRITNASEDCHGPQTGHSHTNLGRRKAWQLRTLCSKGRVAGPGQDGPRPPSPKYDRSISIEVRLAILRKADISTKRAHKAARQHGTCIPWGMSMASLLSKGHQVCSVWSRQFGRAAHHISETAGSTAVA